MSELQNYEGPAEVYANGRLLMEAVRIRVRTSANSNRVHTMARNLAGRSGGPIEVEITLENAIPKVGFEREWIKHLLDRDYIKIVHKSGGRRIEHNVWCEDQEQANAVDQAANETVTLIGGKPQVR